MILVTVATQIEAEPFLPLVKENSSVQLLITGVGPVETAFRLTRHLEKLDTQPEMIINTGVAGAYLGDGHRRKADLLDICLASREVFGDFGVQLEHDYLAFDPAMAGEIEFDLDQPLNDRCTAVLSAAGCVPVTGVFVTVNSASGTRQRGNVMQQRWNGLCENMEGAAVARVCRYYAIPVVELRAVSNMVEDRDLSGWKIKEAVQKAASAVTILCKAMI